MVVGSGVAPGTFITALGSGNGGTGTYVVNLSQTVGSESLVCAVGGVRLAPNSLYVAAYGGSAQSIAQAIWNKKSPGCNYNGNTTATIVDTVDYSPPYPTYTVTFETPTPTPILFAISMQSNIGVPSNAATLIQNAVISAFNGEDGGPRARIGSFLFASRFYSGIASLGSWATIYSIQLGISAANQNSVLMRIDQVPTLSASNIVVTIS